MILITLLLKATGLCCQKKELALEGEFADVGLSFAADSSVVPVTVGPKQKPSGEVPIVPLSFSYY